ncbi:hypothetical protein [Amycolatopsis magusensis]|uniref:hypothetical protein n=1 Tax=Amycolatopsis magusensis TaxID=882444 RepID=UPI0037B98F1E
MENASDLWRQFLEIIETGARSGIPAFADSWGVVMDVIRGVLGVIEPLAPLIGDIAGAALPMITALKLLDKITFGGVSGQLRGVAADMKDADTKRGALATGFMGLAGPGGVLAVAGFALAAYGKMQADARDITRAAADGLREYRDEVQRTGGAVNESTRALARKNIESMDSYNSDKKLVQTAKEHGISIEDLTAAYEGNRAKQAEINQKLGEQKTQWYRLDKGVGDVVQQLAFWGGAASEGGDAAADLQGQLNGLWDQVNGTAESTKILTYEQNLAKKSTKDLEGLMKVLGDSTADAATRGDALIAFLMQLNGQSPTYEDAIQRLNDRFRDLSGLFGENLDKSRGFGMELLNAQGGINTATENGSRLRDMMKDIATNTAGAAQAAYDFAITQGADVPTAMAAANAVVTDQHGRLMGLANQMGIGADAMQTLLNKYALTPEQVMSLIGQPGMQNAQQQTDVYKGKIDQVVGPKSTTFSVDTSNATKAINQWLDWYRVTMSDLPKPQVKDPSLPLVNWDYGGRASGGPVGAGETVWVGEEGPELVTFPRSGHVFDANTSAAMAAAATPRTPAVFTAPPIPAPRAGAGTAATSSGGGRALDAAAGRLAAAADRMVAAARRGDGETVIQIGNREVARASNRGGLLDGRR